MKNLFLRILAIELVLLSFFNGYAKAGESKTLAVSCTIPAIPGVNVPPFPKAEVTKPAAMEEKNQQGQNETKESNTIVVAERGKDLSRNDMQNDVLTQTVYSR